MKIKGAFRVKKSYSMVCFIIIFLFCSCNRLPEEPNEIIKEVTKNMTALTSQQFDTTMELDMMVAGEKKQTKIVSRLTLQKEPFEIHLHTRTQFNEKMEETSDLYCIKGEDGVYYSYLKDKENKSKQNLSEENVMYLSEKYRTPIEYELYFSNIKSFQKVEGQDDGVQILKGSVGEDKVLTILLNTGVLSQLQLTSFPEELLERVKPMDVTIWVNKKTALLEKLELNMTNTFKELVELVFGKESTVIPEINDCRITIDQLKTDRISEITVPDE